MFLTGEGGGRQQSFTQAAPNEMKLGDGGKPVRDLAIGQAVAWRDERERGKEH